MDTAFSKICSLEKPLMCITSCELFWFKAYLKCIINLSLPYMAFFKSPAKEKFIFVLWKAELSMFCCRFPMELNVQLISFHCNREHIVSWVCFSNSCGECLWGESDVAVKRTIDEKFISYHFSFKALHYSCHDMRGLWKFSFLWGKHFYLGQ